jgi:hypothetical protein
LTNEAEHNDPRSDVNPTARPAALRKPLGRPEFHQSPS